ncbi:MAG: hypothetical protein RIM72_11220 [Alphaproteobacteria bacterium]
MGKHSDDSFNIDQNRVHDLQREEDEVAANYARRGEAEYAGKRTNAAGAAMDARKSENSEQKKSERNMREAIFMQDMIAQWEAELDEIRKGMEAIGKLRELEQTGKFDKDNSDHIAYLLSAGIDPDEYINGNRQQLLDDAERGFKDRAEQVHREASQAEQTANLTGDAKRAVQGITQQSNHILIRKEGVDNELAAAANEHIDNIRDTVAEGAAASEAEIDLGAGLMMLPTASSHARSLEGDGSYKKILAGTNELPDMKSDFKAACSSCGLPDAQVTTALNSDMKLGLT